MDAALMLLELKAGQLMLIMKIGPLPDALPDASQTPDVGRTPAGRLPDAGCRPDAGRRPDALKPGIHCARTHWIRGFMAFQLAQHARTVMLMVPVCPESGFLSEDRRYVRAGRGVSREIPGCGPTAVKLYCKRYSGEETRLELLVRTGTRDRESACSG
jgi:hypothetical protein